MDKYVVAPPAGSTQNGVGAADRPWKEGHFDNIKLGGGDLGTYLAESTGYGIVSGCTPTISGLTVTVGAGVVHLADGTRKELSASTVTLDAADASNPRIDLVYITSAGVVAKVTGAAAASPSAPTLPSDGISVATVSVAANATDGVVTYSMDKLTKKQFLVKSIDRFSKATAFITDYVNAAYGEAMTYNTKTKKIILSLWKYASPTANILLVLNKDTYAIEGTYTLDINHPIGVLSYNETDDVIYASLPEQQIFYAIDANNLTSYASLNVPANTAYIAHDNKTGFDVSIYNSGGCNIRVYSNGFSTLVNTIKIPNIGPYQDFCFYDGMIYGASFNYFTEIDVFSGNYVQIGAHSWNEIEGITFVEDNLFIFLHQATADGVEYLYKYMDIDTPQEYNKIAQTNVQETIANISLNLISSDGVYKVSTNNGSTSKYPPNEDAGILTVVNDTKMDSNCHNTFQKFLSTTNPCASYIRMRDSTGTWGNWKQEFLSRGAAGTDYWDDVFKLQHLLMVETHGAQYAFVNKSMGYKRGVVPSSVYYDNAFVMLDEDSAKLGILENTFGTAGSSELALRLFDIKNKTDNNHATIALQQNSSGTFSAFTSVVFRPQQDNTVSCGRADAKWTQVFASTGTINTSDERLKKDISEVDDDVLDAWGDVKWCQFKFKDAAAQKGDEARIHNGLIAQRIKNVFESHGLDASQYGLFCYDEWEAEPEERDSDGNIVKEATPAGNQYSLRYEEALAMEAAYQRRRADRLDARIAAIEKKTESINKEVTQ